MLALLVTCAPALAVRTGDALIRALSSTRPVVVHVWDPRPTEIVSMDVEELSSVCRDAGAAAMLVPPSLVGAVAKEQATAVGNFPGPLPVIADCELESVALALGVDGATQHGSEASEEQPVDLPAWKSMGAVAVGIRCAP